MSLTSGKSMWLLISKLKSSDSIETKSSSEEIYPKFKKTIKFNSQHKKAEGLHSLESKNKKIYHPYRCSLAQLNQEQCCSFLLLNQKGIKILKTTKSRQLHIKAWTMKIMWTTYRTIMNSINIDQKLAFTLDPLCLIQKKHEKYLPV